MTRNWPTPPASARRTECQLERSANTILVASRRPEGHFAACLVLATTRLDVNGLVRQRLGVREGELRRR